MEFRDVVCPNCKEKFKFFCERRNEAIGDQSDYWNGAWLMLEDGTTSCYPKCQNCECIIILKD